MHLPGHYGAVTALVNVSALFTAIMENLIKREELLQMLVSVFFLLLIYHLSKMQILVKA